MSARWMIYGANGHTGARLAQRAIARGERPWLAGRDAVAVADLASAFSCPFRVFSVDDPGAMRAALEGVDAVVNCAGPFSRTAVALANACIDAGVSYLDIGGEVDVIEELGALDARARAAGVLVVPAVGYAHTDALAATLAADVAAPRSVEVALRRFGPASRGTMRTVLEAVALGGRVRRGGTLVEAAEAGHRRIVPFASGATHCGSTTSGDLGLLHASTGARDVTFYLGMPPWVARLLSAMAPFGRLLRSATVRRLIEAALHPWVGEDAVGQGPVDGMEYWMEVGGRGAERRAATMTTPNIYDLTIEAALGAVERTLGRASGWGVRTPSCAFGSDFGVTLPGVEVRRLGTHPPRDVAGATAAG